MKFARSGLFILVVLVICSPDNYAAKRVNLRHQPVALLQAFAYGASQGLAMKEISRERDSSSLLHLRLQETWLGYEISGADVVLHIHGNAKTRKSLLYLATADPGTTMNGMLYLDLASDLAYASPARFTASKAQQALQQAKSLYLPSATTANITQQHTSLFIWITDQDKARWAYRVNFRVETEKARPIEAVYILDAITYEVLANWDDIHTLALVEVQGGGWGGNIKTGQQIYDGLENHLSSLLISRDEVNNLCLLQNQNIIVRDFSTKKVMSFPCLQNDSAHGGVYWNADFDAVNHGYSPANDAFFGASVVMKMYENWYGTAVLTDSNGEPGMIKVLVHKKNFEDAYWDHIAHEMVFGDGYKQFYPLTSVDITAHELSHGFTREHSRLFYMGQSGAINEAFSDMAAIAADVYAYGPLHHGWQIAGSVIKAAHKSLRYLDKPSRDCGGKHPGSLCSIDDASQYRSGLDVHYASGVYNHFFYYLATTPDWDVRKAFAVMVQANRYYWTAASSFNEGACNVISAADQLGYDVTAVKNAFDAVKVNYRQFC